jgi:hypothetical protein
MKSYMSKCVGAVMACQAVQATLTTEGSCSAIVSKDKTFAEYDKPIDNVLAETQATEEDHSIMLAQVSTQSTIVLPDQPNLGNNYVLDSDQLRILDRKRVVWNGDMTTVNNGPPLDGAEAVSGWRFFWAGVKNSDIAIEKEQVRKVGNKLILEHWDHVMTFPAACEHAMQVINTHLSQIKIY